jgi:hypothetical protein
MDAGIGRRQRSWIVSGNVIGVVVAQLNAITMMQAGSVPQNVNFAIQAPIVMNFL